MPRHIDTEEVESSFFISLLKMTIFKDRDDLRTSIRRNNTHLNTNNSNNNGTSARLATVKSAKTQPNVKIY